MSYTNYRNSHTRWQETKKTVPIPDTIQSIQKFRKEVQGNRRCANCGDLGSTYICMDFGTFVCIVCAGLHRELNHRVKGIAESQWNANEVKFILSRGNVRDHDKYLAQLPPDGLPVLPIHIDRLRQLIKQKYIEKRWVQNELHNSNAQPLDSNPRRETTPPQDEQTSPDRRQPELIEEDTENFPTQRTTCDASQQHSNTVSRGLSSTAATTVSFFDFPELPPTTIDATTVTPHINTCSSIDVVSDMMSLSNPQGNTTVRSKIPFEDPFDLSIPSPLPHTASLSLSTSATQKQHSVAYPKQDLFSLLEPSDSSHLFSVSNTTQLKTLYTYSTSTQSQKPHNKNNDDWPSVVNIIQEDDRNIHPNVAAISESKSLAGPIPRQLPADSFGNWT